MRADTVRSVLWIPLPAALGFELSAFGRNRCDSVATARADPGGGIVLQPRRWFGAVVLIGGAQAVVSALSAAVIGEGGRIDPVASGGPPRLILSALVLVSVMLPFVAYAADSRHVLLRHPRSAVAAWQVIGGLAGLSVTLAALHAAVLAMGSRAGASDDIWLVYSLVVPAFVIGALGATAGTVLGLLGHLLFGRIAAGRGGTDPRPF